MSKRKSRNREESVENTHDLGEVMKESPLTKLQVENDSLKKKIEELHKENKKLENDLWEVEMKSNEQEGNLKIVREHRDTLQIKLEKEKWYNENLLGNKDKEIKRLKEDCYLFVNTIWYKAYKFFNRRVK